MINRIGSGFVAIIAGLLIALGPQFIFPLCDQKEDGSWMKCHWMSQAEIGVGAMIGVLGIAVLLAASPRIRLGLSIGIATAGALALAIPTVLVGGCGMATMSCRSMTIPCLIVISVLVIVGAAANCVHLSRLRETEEPGQPRP